VAGGRHIVRVAVGTVLCFRPMSSAEESRGVPPGGNLRQKHVRQLLKTEMCKFFLANRCGKGNRCAFAHSLTEIREKPDLLRTSMCKNFLQTGNCDNPHCTFAHDERELRTTEGFFKTKLCRFAASGRCKHGAQCRFAHAVEELSTGYPGAGGMAVDPRMQSNLMGSVPTEASLPPQRPMRSQSQQIVDVGDSDFIFGSDQSTRADTSVSVPTPEGSGDSGQEELASWKRRADMVFDAGRRRGDQHAALGAQLRGERMPGRHCTTMTLTNVPNFLTQGALVSLLEDLTVCMRGAFDFFYCPWDSYQDRNLGYAIINFFSRSIAAEFEKQWVNQPLLPRTQSTKRLRIVPAALQGRAANLRHFSGFSLAHHEDVRFRPLVRAGPNEPLRPMVISEELVQRRNNNSSSVPTNWTAPSVTEEETVDPAADVAPMLNYHSDLAMHVQPKRNNPGTSTWNGPLNHHYLLMPPQAHRPEAASKPEGEDEVQTVPSCWALLVPNSTNGMGSVDSMSGPGNMANVGGVPYYHHGTLPQYAPSMD